MKNIAIVNFEMGNLDSVARAVEECGANPVITSKNRDLEEASAIILPGVGTFAKGMQNIKRLNLYDTLDREARERKTPVLGICLGMQLFATKGHEGGETAGFNWIAGEVKPMAPDEKDRRIPHIGWDEVVILREDKLFFNIPSGKDFYFVHSYRFVCKNETDILSWTAYCDRFPSALRRDNIVGVQFHPEKSQRFGLQMIRNFCFSEIIDD